jgi:hypothetical protein
MKRETGAVAGGFALLLAWCAACSNADVTGGWPDDGVGVDHASPPEAGGGADASSPGLDAPEPDAPADGVAVDAADDAPADDAPADDGTVDATDGTADATDGTVDATGGTVDAAVPDAPEDVTMSDGPEDASVPDAPFHGHHDASADAAGVATRDSAAGRD